MPFSRSLSARYAVFVVVPALLVAVLLQFGDAVTSVRSEAAHATQAVASAISAATATSPATAASAPAPASSGASAFSLSRLVLQLVVVLLAARLFGTLARRLGQPAVIGEMLAGICLGPSLFGAIAPEWSARIFPVASLGVLNGLSQLGVLLFLFVVGLHLDIGALRRQRGTAVIASHASIAAPFTLGAMLALLIYDRFAPNGVSFTSFALFLGVAMSITAFPVLARILEERRQLGTPLATLALACAAVDDVTAWILLAAVVSIVRTGGGLMPLLLTFGGTLLFGLVMFRVVAPQLERWAARYAQQQQLSAGTISAIVLLLLCSALATEAIGVHALFGAFVAGAIIPRSHGFADRLGTQLGDVLVILLLPLFFAFTGLRTDFRSVASADALPYLAAILAVAIVGKVGGTALAARSSGQTWRDATMLGVLMNTRGLMELVVLNVGLDLGILTPPLFAMMVIMALVTTMMTVPLLSLIERRSATPAH